MRDETTGTPTVPTVPPVPASGTVHWIGTGLSTGAAGLGLSTGPNASWCGAAPRSAPPRCWRVWS